MNSEVKFDSRPKKRLLGGPVRRYSLTGKFTGIDVNKVRAELCVHCPANCDIQPGTIHLGPSSIEAKISRRTLTATIHGNSPEDVKRLAAGTACFIELVGRDTVDAKIDESSLTR